MRVAVASLGCAKNLVDAEQMMGRLLQAGHQLTDREAEAEIILVNTCGFIGPAKEESINTIIELGRMKEEGRCRALIVTGCLSQRYREELLDELPEVDAVLGTGDYPKIVEVIERALSGERVIEIGRPVGDYPEALPRQLSASGPSAYLKIAEGCDNACSYCVIPSLRGRYRSRALDKIVAEARVLAGSGVKELIVIAQDTTAYGLDLWGEPRLDRLLGRLDGVDGIEWIRVLYSYPTNFTDRLIEAMACRPRVVKYLDIPLQHGADRVLKEMNRRGDPAAILRLLDKLRVAIPEIVLRTSLIVGFPGETEDDFEELLDFIRAIRFDHLGVFTYSREEGTPAGGRADQVPEEVKRERYRQAMEVQQRIAFEKNSSQIGREVRLLIEGVDVRRPGRYQGRWAGQAPGIDGLTFLKGEVGSYRIGDLVPARIIKTHGYDMEVKAIGS